MKIMKISHGVNLRYINYLLHGHRVADFLKIEHAHSQYLVIHEILDPQQYSLLKTSEKQFMLFDHYFHLHHKINS